MKLRTTTPASTSLATKLALIFFSVIVAVAVPLQMTQKVSADEYDDRINALQQDIIRYQAEGARLNGESATLKSALAQLSNEKAAIQAQVDISQAKHDQLVIQIAETEQKIIDNQGALGDIIANIYVDDKISPLEMLASSNNISDYMDKQEYRSSVRNELTSTIGEIKDLKKQLDTQKIEVTKVLEDQKAQRDSLIAKENEQQGLLQKTQGQEAGYQQLINSSQAAIAEAKATQILVNSRFNGNGGYTLIDSGSMGGYPWDSSNCAMWGYLSTGGSDGNGSDGHGYGCRQCASYVAWKIAKETGKYYSWGNAVNFTANAKAEGYVEGSAQAGSIAVMDPGKAGQSYGHVAWVEANNGDGTITISQYNYNYGAGYGMYSMMVLSVNAFDHYVQIK
ncbi:MAG: CHAP domain-containing protein [Candidatus Saccharibacteria bacterium]